MTHVVDLRASFIGTAILPQVLPSGATNGTGLDTLSFGLSGPITAIIATGAVAGTSPTLDVKLQESVDNSTFTDITGATMTQITAANGTGTILSFIGTKRYVRAVATVGGSSTPTFAASVLLFGQAKITGTGAGSSVSPQT